MTVLLNQYLTPCKGAFKYYLIRFPTFWTPTPPASSRSSKALIPLSQLIQ